MPPVLVLNRDDVVRLLPAAACIELMDQAFRALAAGEIFNPLRSILRPPGVTTLLGVMPAYRGGGAGRGEGAGPSPVYGLKAVAIAPGNAALGIDTHQGAVLLLDGATGETRALLDASSITAIRTAAVSAVATRALARPGARVLALLGAGVQARSHAEAHLVLQPWDEFRVWARRPEEAERLAAELAAGALGTPAPARAVAAPSAEAAVRGADVVCTLTAARDPVIVREWLVPGAHINAVGSSSPAARELDTATVRDAALFADLREAALAEAGDILIPLGEGAITATHIRAELGDVLAGLAPGRRSPGELTVFKSLGLAGEDLVAAEFVWRAAVAARAGTSVEL